jgi:hypothetical protein
MDKIIIKESVRNLVAFYSKKGGIDNRYTTDKYKCYY